MAAALAGAAMEAVVMATTAEAAMETVAMAAAKDTEPGEAMVAFTHIFSCSLRTASS